MLQRIGDIVYRYRPGSSGFPDILFLPGFRSDMQGTKALFLDEKTAGRGQGYLSLDYSGHGQSGGAFEDGTIGRWIDDALSVIDAVSAGPLIIVGSSMGGWIGLQVALQRAGVVAGFIGIAAAPDFTRDITRRMTDAQKQEMDRHGRIAVPSDYGDDLIITRDLIDDGETHCLLDKTLPLSIPMTLIQGRQDADVDWRTPDRIKAALPGAAVETVMIGDGDHRLSRDTDLRSIDDHVVKMSSRLRAGGD